MARKGILSLDFHFRAPKGFCGNCKGPLPKYRKRWCSDKCMDEAWQQTNPGFMRGAVYQRDKGICAKCGKDCSHEAWEADHIVPLIEGGANTLKNMRTLCILCHKGETRELAARRARQRRAHVRAERRKVQPELFCLD